MREPKTCIGHVPGIGRGVFAACDLERDEVIEVCPVIVVPREEVGHLDQTRLYDYYFGWGEDLQAAAVALGHGSLYNHSYDPNSRYEKNLRDDTITFRCIREIARGEEIRVNYHGNPGDRSPVWFDVR